MDLRKNRLQMLAAIGQHVMLRTHASLDRGEVYGEAIWKSK